MVNKPKFVIGIGSQRAGSTLLHRILDECTNIFMHPVKELHYFDTLHNVRHQNVLTLYSQRQLDRELDRIIQSKGYSFLEDKGYKCYLRTNKILAGNLIDYIDYIDLFRPCLHGNEVIGEITPEYMILPESGIKNMQEIVGKDAKILLITRNPVDRFISAFKLLKFYNNKNADMSDFEREILSIHNDMPQWVEQQKALNNYALAEENYRRFFDDVLVISYEDLTQNPKKIYKVLESFLGVDMSLSRYENILGNKVNEIGATADISPSTYAEIALLIESDHNELNYN